MKTTYCCNQKAFENYYVSQVGTGLPYFSGSQYQKGYGLGSIFSSLGRAILPLVRSTGKALGKEVCEQVEILLRIFWKEKTSNKQHSIVLNKLV